MILSAPTLLIVEDDQMLQGLYADECNRLGLAFVQLYDGSAALDYIRHQIDGVHAIILDFMLPDMDGRVILETIKDSNLAAPTIVVSAIAEKTDDLTTITPGAVLEVIKGDVPLRTIMHNVKEYIAHTNPDLQQSVLMA